MNTGVTLWQRVGGFLGSRLSGNGANGHADTPSAAIVAGVDGDVAPAPAGWWRRRQIHRDQQQQLATRILDLADALHDHFRRQDRRTEEIVRSLDRISGTIEQLAAERQTDHAQIGTIASHTEIMMRHSAGMQDSLARLPEAVLEQSGVMREIATRVQAVQRIDDQLAHSLETVKQAVDTLGSTSPAQVEAIRRLSETQHAALEQLVRVQTRRLLVVSLVAGALAVAGLTAALTILVMQLARP